MPAIISAFGAEYVDETGGLNRPAMRSHVFSDAAARHRLEMILHPLIKAEAARLILNALSPYVVLVVPLLAEHLPDYRELVDRILVVDCDEAQQLRRIAARPTMNMEQAKAILAAQHRRNARLAIADDVIDNRGDLAALARQVTALHAQYLSVAQEKSTTKSNNSLQ
jgi:dephospho-CoA kinase